VKRFHLLTAVVVAGVLVAATACHGSFDPKLYTTPDTLYAAAMKEYAAKHWDNAAQAFELLTRDLPARDPRLPIAYYYLAKAQENHDDHLLAAQSFSRLAEAFPEDSLADDAMLESGLAYSRMWSKPQLDPQYGQLALTTLQSMVSLYPDSPLLERANREIARLENMFAIKDFEVGDYYFRRHAYDSAILYFKDVVRLYPSSSRAREAYFRLLAAYRIRHYDDDARDVCESMQKTYSNDPGVRARCGSVSSAAASTPRT